MAPRVAYSGVMSNAAATKPFASALAAKRALTAASRTVRAIRLSDNADATAEQRAAVTDTRDSEVGIIAGPGTGKTHTLAARAAYLIEAGADPASILILTFTRSAASSIAERVAATCQRKIEARTFHGYAARHVLADGERVATEIEEDAAFRSLYTGAAKRDGIPGKRELRELISMEEAHEAYPLLAGAKAMSILEHRLKCAGLVPTWILLKRLGEMIAADDSRR